VNDLQDLLKKDAAKDEPGTARSSSGERPERAGPQGARDASSSVVVKDRSSARITLEQIQGIEVEAVVGGVLQRIRFAPGVNPADVGAMLRGLDPGVKLRDDFPRGRAGGPRATLEATVVVINVRVADSGTFVDLVCQADGDDLSVAVPRKAVQEFLETVKGLGRLSAEHAEKLTAFSADAKGSMTIVITEEERFTVAYWRTDDGRAFLDRVIEASAQPKAGGGSSDG